MQQSRLTNETGVTGVTRANAVSECDYVAAVNERSERTGVTGFEPAI
ncbi:hypothetical protein [Halobaculum rarum]